MTSLFETYEDEFRDFMKQLSDEVAALRQTLQRDAPTYRPPPGTGPLSRLGKLRLLRDLVTKMRELIQWMERELTSVEFPIPKREASREKLAEYKKQLLISERDLKKLADDASAADRADLIGSGGGSVGAADGASAVPGLDGLDDETRRQRIQMAKNTETVKKGTTVLREAERLGIEMEAMSHEALKGLTDQTHTISGIIGKTNETDEVLSQARKVLSDMHKEMIKNKAILLIIILVLLLMIFLVLYVKFHSATSTDSTTIITYVTGSPGVTLPPPPPTNVSTGSGSSLGS